LPFCSTSFSRGRTSWCESEASRALGQYDGITSTWRKCRQMPCRAGTAWQIAVPCRQAKAKYCGMPAPAAAIAVPCRQRLKPTARILARRAGFWRRSAAPRYRAPSLTIHAGAARCTGPQAAAFTYLQAYAQVSKGWCGFGHKCVMRVCGRCSQDQPESRVWSGGWKVLAGPLARQMLRTRVPREWAAIPVLYQPSGRRSHHMAEWPSGPRRTWERGGRWWGR
jgi:hypothetical protein